MFSGWFSGLLVTCIKQSYNARVKMSIWPHVNRKSTPFLLRASLACYAAFIKKPTVSGELDPCYLEVSALCWEL